MSAVHKPKGPFYKPFNKSRLDQILDFGEEETKEKLSSNSTQRLKQVVKKIDELNERIEKLTKRY